MQENYSLNVFLQQLPAYYALYREPRWFETNTDKLLFRTYLRIPIDVFKYCLLPFLKASPVPTHRKFWFCRSSGVAIPMVSLTFHERVLVLSFQRISNPYGVVAVS